jgi:hypothetical protein
VPDIGTGVVARWHPRLDHDALAERAGKFIGHDHSFS